MAWNNKYRLSYYNLSGSTVVLNIKENATVSLTNVDGLGEEPIVIKRAGLRCIRSSICEIGLVASSLSQLDSLYTNDPFKYKVEISIGEDLYWRGFLDTELYNVSLVRGFNVERKFVALDSLALLRRLDFMDTSGSAPVKFTGIKSYWNLLQLAFTASQLDFTYIYVGCSTVGSQTNQSGENSFLHSHFVRCDNFYDNSGRPLKWKQVLEGIFGVWNIYVQLYKGDVYVYDAATLLRGSFPWKRYNNSYNYVDSPTIDSNGGSLNSLYPGDLQEEKLPGVQKAIVKSSLYYNNKLISYDVSEDSIGSEIGYQDHTGDSDYAWREYFYQYKYPISAGYGVLTKYKGIGNLNNAIEEYRLSNYLFFTQYYTAFSILYKPYLLNQYNISKYGLLVKMKVKFRTKDYPDKDSGSSGKVYRAVLPIQIKVGNKQAYNGPSDIQFGPSATSWVTAGSPSNRNTFGLKYHYSDIKSPSPIEDKWLVNGEFRGEEWVEGQVIPLTGQLMGELEVNILTRAIILDRVSGNMSMYVDGLYIGGISIMLVELATLNPPSYNDIEYRGELDKNWKEEMSSVELIHGTNKPYFPHAKGAIISYDETYYIYDEVYYRYYSAGGNKEAEKVLLNTMVSNLTNAVSRLSGSFNIPSSLVKYFSHSSFTGKKFLVDDVTEYLRIGRMEAGFLETNIEQLDVI